VTAHTDPATAADPVLDLIVDLAMQARRTSPPAEARHAAARMMMDALGCAFGGYHDDVPALVRSFAARRPQAGGTHIVGTDLRVSADVAAFTNAVMVRYLDLNDTYVSTAGVGHPSDYIPAVLSAAETAGPTPGQDVLDGVVLTYEVFCRLTDVTRLGVERWDHVLNGAVASAVGAAHVLALPPELLRHAVALALVPNVALQATRLNDVSMWKGCASGNAARNALVAVELAADGLTGPAQPFTGRGGLFAALGHEPNFDAWHRDSSAILSCDVKQFPAGYFSQSAVQAALDLRGPGLPLDEVTEVEVGTFAFGVNVMAGDREKWAPATRETADHSLPYVVAHALSHGRLDADSYTAAALTDPRTRSLLDRLTVTQDPDSDRAWPQASRNRVTVRFKDGQHRSSAVTHYLGHHANPMTDAQVQDKFTHQTAPVLGPTRTEGLAAAIWALEHGAALAPVFEAAGPRGEDTMTDRDHLTIPRGGSRAEPAQRPPDRARTGPAPQSPRR